LGSEPTEFWGTLQDEGTASPTPPLNGNAKSGGADIMRWCGADTSSRNLCPIPAQTYRGYYAKDPRLIDAAVADDWCWGAESEGQAIAGDGRCSTQGAAEY